MNPALSQEFYIFCEQEHPQRHANTDKNRYCVYGTLKKNQNAPRPPEHPPVRGGNAKTFRWNHRLQIQNLFMAFKRVPQIRRRWRAARSLTSQGRGEPLCARIESANREVSEGKADLWPRSFFFLRGPQGAANGQDSWGFFKDAQGFGRLDTGSRAGFTSSRPPPPWTSYVNFPYFCTMCGLEKLGIVDQNWLERFCPVCC